MRKTTKGLLSVVLSAAMVLTAGILPAKQEAAKAADGVALSDGGFTAELNQDNSGIFKDWTVDSVTITETGTYTLGGTAEDDVDNLLAKGMYLAVNTTLKEWPTTYKIVPKEIKVNDTVYDWSKSQLVPEGGPAMLGTNFLRLPVVNNYVGIAKEEWPYQNPLATNVNGTATYENPIEIIAGDKVEFVFTVEEGGDPAPGAGTTTEPTAAPAQKSYNAYFAFQTDQYIFRNNWDDASYGLNATKDDKGNNTKGLFSSSAVYWGKDDKLLKAPATYTDTKIEANGSYTVGMKGVDLSTLKGDAADAKVSTAFNMLFVSTDIPLTMSGVSAKATLKIDGKDVIAKAVAAPRNIDSKYYQFYISDTYSTNHETEKCAYPAGKLLKTMPKESIEINFTISGVKFGDFKGRTFTKGGIKYKVTKASSTKAGTVAVAGLSSAGKKKSSLTVPATVKDSVGSYKVSTLGKKAFKSSKAKSITLNKNIKKIPASAFASCKNLTKLTLKAKLTSVAKNSFKGCKKKIAVKGTSASANKKKLKKSGYTSFK